MNRDKQERGINTSVEKQEQNGSETNEERIITLQKALADEKNRSEEYLNQMK